MSAATEKLKAVATGAPEKEVTPYMKLRHALEARRGEFKALMGTEEAVNRFIRVVLNAAQQTPALLSADARTLLVACMKAAQDGLLPDGREAVLNIYNTNVGTKAKPEWIPAVQYLPMVAGLVKKLYDSGHVTFVDAAAVYERDHFEYERGDNPKLVHRPFLGDDPGAIVASYVVAKLKNGEIKREVMPRRDIEKVRAASKASEGPGWTNWYDQFAIKSVIKRAYKQLPSSIELEAVIRSDNEAMGFAQLEPTDALPLTTQQALPERAGGVPIPGMSVPTDEKVPVSNNGKPKNGEQKAEPLPEPSVLEEIEHCCAHADVVDELDLARDLARGLQGEEAAKAAKAIADAEERFRPKKK